MASEKDDYRRLLTQLIASSGARGDSALREYLASRSNLPGPRGNLELLEAFATTVGEASSEGQDLLWALALELRESTDEFLAMCGVRGIGAIGEKHPRTFSNMALSALRESARNSSWRVREAVAMALQDMIWSDPRVAERLNEWVRGGDWLEMRAVAAGVAEPKLLRGTATARSALLLHEAIFDRVLDAPVPRKGDFRVLRQALGYSLSVIIAALPEEGLSYMKALIAKRDADVLWVCRENLKKNRLRSRFPGDVKALTMKATGRP